MEEMIKLSLSYKIDPIIIEEEAYNKAYYLAHPESELDTPSKEEAVLPLLSDEHAPYARDKTYQKSTVHQQNINDSILNYFHTDIYAHIPPNYMPTILHGHTYFEIVFVLSGHCINYSGNQILTLSEGDFLIMAPNTLHGISAFHDDCRIVNIMIRSSIFQKTFFEHFTKDDILYTFFNNVLYQYKTNSYLLFHTGTDKLIQTLVISLLEEIRHRHSYQEQVKQSYMQLLFARLLNRHSGHAAVYHDGINTSSHDVTLILAYMQEHYQKLKLADLAAFFGYSQRQISRILLNYTQKNYQENMIEIKMRKAAQLLLQTKASIDKITELLGYSTPFGFRKQFKEYYGVTPSNFRAMPPKR